MYADWLKHRGLVDYQAARHARIFKRLVTFEELRTTGLMGLWKAAKNFDANKCPGIKFEGFAKFHVRGEIMDFIRDSMNKFEMPKRKWLAARDHKRESPEALNSVIVDDRSRDEIDDREWIAHMLPKLKRRQRQVVELRLRDMDFKEIGKQLGLTENGVRQSFKHAVQQLRELSECETSCSSPA